MIFPCSCKATKRCLGTLDKLVMHTKGSTVSWKYALPSIHKIFPQFSRGLSAFFYHYRRLHFCLFSEVSEEVYWRVNPNIHCWLQKQVFPLIMGGGGKKCIHKCWRAARSHSQIPHCCHVHRHLIQTRKIASEWDTSGFKLPPTYDQSNLFYKTGQVAHA